MLWPDAQGGVCAGTISRLLAVRGEQTEIRGHRVIPLAAPLCCYGQRAVDDALRVRLVIANPGQNGFGRALPDLQKLSRPDRIARRGSSPT